MTMKRAGVAALLAVLVVFLVPPAAAQKAGKPKLAEATRKWIEEEVVYIITPVEREVFLKLQTDRERDLFIEAFWRQRDPTPGTPENEFKTEHFRSSDTGPTGWRRGRVG